MPSDASQKYILRMRTNGFGFGLKTELTFLRDQIFTFDDTEPVLEVAMTTMEFGTHKTRNCFEVELCHVEPAITLHLGVLFRLL